MSPIFTILGQISLTSGQDTSQKLVINSAEVTEPHRTIGSYQTPTGNMTKEITIKEQAIMSWGPPLQTSTVYPNLVHRAYKTILIPKLDFSLTCTTMTAKQLQALQTKADGFMFTNLV